MASTLSLSLTRGRVVFCLMGSWPRRTLGLSLLRMGLGAALLHFYLSSYQDRLLIWGPTRLSVPAGLSRHSGFFDVVSPFGIWKGRFAFELVFHASLVAAVAFTVVGGRLLTGLNWLFLYSIHSRNPLILDGGDNLLRILLLLMLLTETDLHFSPRAARHRERWTRRLTHGSPQLRTFAHNCGVALIAFQVLTVYGVAVLWKLGGEAWRNGTAMYYISNTEEFAYRGLPAFVVNNSYFITAITYSVIAGQVTIVVLGLFRGRGPVLLVIALLLHVGIALSMGLVTFSLVMISADAALLRDADWVAVLGFVFGRHRGRSETSEARQAVSGEERAEVGVSPGGLSAPATHPASGR